MTEQHTQGRLVVMFWPFPEPHRWIARAPATPGSSKPGEQITGPIKDEAVARELVRRWNAFEPGGAVERLISATDAAAYRMEDNGMGGWKEAKALRAALAALVEPGAGAGKEPQG